jgi:C4-dicarboxylate-specific signal transduction histidine kinase
MIDITERKLIEQNDRKRMLELAHTARLSTMGEMTTEIAHELNQPLSAIMTFSDAGLNIIKSQRPDMEPLLSALNGIAHQAQRAGDIIKGLRSFIGKQETHATTTDINSLIHSVLKLIEVEARSHNIYLEYHLDEKLPYTILEKILIEQVILNLVRNAIEALSDIQNRKRILSISSKINRENMIEVTIEDSGPGISKKDPGKIFEAFYTTKPNGMGMGLAICRKIIEAHGGSITVQNNIPYGTRFSFTLPAYRNSVKENE